MDDDGEGGAIAAAKYYLGLYLYVHETGDLTKWEAMALPGCDYCDSVGTTVSELFSEGGHYKMGKLEFVADPVADFVEGFHIWDVTLRVTIGKSQVFNAEGEVTEEYPATRNKLVVGVVHQGGEWRVSGMRAAADVS